MGGVGKSRGVCVQYGAKRTPSASLLFCCDTLDQPLKYYWGLGFRRFPSPLLNHTTRFSAPSQPPIELFFSLPPRPLWTDLLVRASGDTVVARFTQCWACCRTWTSARFAVDVCSSWADRLQGGPALMLSGMTHVPGTLPGLHESVVRPAPSCLGAVASLERTSPDLAFLPSPRDGNLLSHLGTRC